MRFAFIAPVVALIIGCDPAADYVAGEPGTPLPDLSEAELSLFREGQSAFNRIFTPEEGLGPTFNENQCSACHTVPAIGGTTGFERIVKATRYMQSGRCDLLADEGGQNIRSRATPLLQAHGVSSEDIPASATEIGRFLPTFLFGLGLIEAIPEATIVARADADDADGDGISGRAARGPDGRLLRFGRKADVATLEAFTRSALRLEMGLTTGPDEPDLVGGRAPPDGTDPVTEPEVDERTVEALTAFARYLAPPAPSPPRSPEHADTLWAGQRLMGRLGCIACHVPSMRTGPNDNPALATKTVRLYSDLLLHDMGADLANVCAIDAEPSELRTTPLMGLGHRQLFLHDGRAFDLREAIMSHGGEATAARDAFARLPWLQQEFLLMFLRSL